MNNLRRLRRKGIWTAVFTLAVVVFGVDARAQQTFQYFPQLADGGEYVTYWQFTGLGRGSSAVTLELFQPDGNPLTLPTDRGNAPSYTFNLGATERTSIRTLGTGSTVRVGSARVTSTLPVGVTEVFQRVRGGGVIGQAGVLPSEPRRFATLFVSRNSSGRNTGIAIVNTSPSPGSVNLTLHNQAGTPMQTVPLSLPARGQIARFFDELFGSVGAFEGTISISSMSRFSVVALLLDGEQLSTLPTLPGRLVGMNLITNGNAEAGAASATGNEQVTVPGWSTTGGLTVVRYGTSSFPSPASPGPFERGNNFFAGGPNSAESSAVQRIDLSALATFIDGDLLTFNQSGYFGGFGDQGDDASLIVEFLDITGKVLGSTWVGYIDPDDRQSVTGLLFRSESRPVPRGARSALVTLGMTRSAGQFNDGYADNLSLILSEPK